MTEISYKGANCIVIQTKHVTTIVDPFIDTQKISKVIQKAQVILTTEPRFAVTPLENQKLFASPGEYEIGDVSIRSFAARAQLDSDKSITVFRIESGDCSIGILGHIQASVFQEAQFEQLGMIDILIIPVGGGGYTIDAHDATNLTRHIDPKVVIPVHFQEDDINYEVPQASVELFIKELSVPVQNEQTLRIKQAGQLPDTLTLVRLDRTS